MPRNVSGADLVKAFRTLGYECVRQDGPHIRLTTERSGTHHITVPNHAPIKLGTVSATSRQWQRITTSLWKNLFV